MSLSNQFATDTAKEVDGVVIQYGQNDDGSIPGFHISRMSRANVRYTKALEVATRPYRRQIELGTLANDIAERVFTGVFVDSVLKGWENVALSDVTGDASDTGYAPFNRANALALFGRLPELYEDLQNQAKSAAMFKDEQLEDEAKN
uniref:Tail assembly chaperone n=1 Tax=Pseudomonas phage Pavpe01 TaxID=3138545 RepID=A0AAU6VZZ5_9VIRU